jgi:RHS repeat-associated protein
MFLKNEIIATNSNFSLIVQIHTSNHLGGFEDDYFAYTFTGKVKQHQHVHSASGKATQTEVYTYTYDHVERLLSVTHKLNNAAAITLAEYTYDEIGRLKTKKLHGGKETSIYDYNVRSWITQISGSKFNQTLVYNTAVNGVTPSAASYNGNISAMKWKVGDETTERGYQFAYDGLNRMASAYYGEGSSLTTNPNRYNELPTYDKMGNIKTLQRQGKQDSGYGLIDNLSYAYTGNQLTKVTDAVNGPLYNGAFHFMDGANVATEYVYDKNGNLIKDYNKKIVDIQYNALNLPDALQFTNGNTTKYTYDAAGAKLSVTYQTAVAGITIPMTSVMTPLAAANILVTTKTDYCGNVIYENGAISKILTEEGYITLSGATPTYHYYLKDHQGNNRVVLSQSGAVEQVNHYYPFGGLFGESTGGATQPYKYNGKELDRMHGLDLFDYGARHYDATLGRWFAVDPMGEKYYNISPYVYVANNPIRFIDTDGRKIVQYNYTHYNKSGYVSGTLGLSNKTEAAMRDYVNTKEGRSFLSQYASAGDVVGGYKFEKDGALSNQIFEIKDFSFEKETGHIVPFGSQGSISKPELNGKGDVKMTLKVYSLGYSKEDIGETITHELQVHGYKKADEANGKKVTTEIQDHKALKNKDLKHEGFKKYESVRKELEIIDTDYIKAFKDAEKKYQEIY